MAVDKVKGQVVVEIHQGLYGFPADSQAELNQEIAVLKTNKNGITNDSLNKLITAELKERYAVTNINKIVETTLIADMSSNLGITLTASEITDLTTNFNAVGIVKQLLGRADVDSKFAGPINTFLQQVDANTATYGPGGNLLGHAPTDITPNSTSVSEGIFPGTTVLTLGVADVDAGDAGKHVFSLVNDPSGKFEIVGTQVKLKAGQLLDFETAASHQITVKVVDPLGFSYQETLTINVTDVVAEPGAHVPLQLGLDLIDKNGGATANDDLFTGNTTFNQAFIAGPANATGTATPGDTVDGDKGTDTLALSISGAVDGIPQVESTGVTTNNVENLVVINSLTTGTGVDVVVDMTTHNQVNNVKLQFSSTDILLRDMQAAMAGGTVVIQDPTPGVNVQLDFDIQSLQGASDQLNVIVDEMTGGALTITQNNEGKGGKFGNGDAAALEKLNVSFEGQPSQLDAITSALTKEFVFTGNKDAVLGLGVGAVDQFGTGAAAASTDSFFSDMGNTATLINASAMTGSLYINLSEAAASFTFSGSGGNDLTVLGDSLTVGSEATKFDGKGGINTAVLWDEASVEGDDNLNSIADNPLVNYQNVLFTEALGAAGSVMDARYFGAATDINLMDGLAADITVNNVDGATYHFKDENQLSFNGTPFTDDDGLDAKANGKTMTFNKTGAAATVTVQFDDTTVTDDVTFAGTNVGVMSVGGTGGLTDLDVTFNGGMDKLTTINASGTNQIDLLSTGSLALLNKIDASTNSGGVRMQDGALSVTATADHQAVSDIVSEVSGLTLIGGTGKDTLIGSNGVDSITGGDNDDTLFGNGGGDTINAGAGDDKAQGGDGDDIMNGGTGNDLLVGGDGKDTVNGEAGADKLYGWAGDDTLDGGADSGDVVKGGGGKDIVKGGLGVDEHWGDRDASDEPANGLGTPQKTTIDINDADIGDVFTVSVTDHGGTNYLVSVASATGSEADIAAAIVTALEGKGMNPALVSSIGDKVEILGVDNNDVFTVATTVTNVPGVGTFTYAATGADIGDQLTFDVNGVTKTLLVTEDLADDAAVAAFVAAAITAAAIPNITATVSAGVITVTNLAGPFSSFNSTIVNNAAAFLDIKVTDFEDGEQVSVIVDGITYTNGGAGISAEDALKALGDAIIAGEGVGTMSHVIEETAPGAFTLRIIDTLAANDLNDWGDQGAGDVVSNVQVLLGDGGTGNTPTIDYLVETADAAVGVLITTAGTDAGDTSTIATIANVPDTIDVNTGSFEDKFVIETNAAATNITPLVTGSDDGAAGFGDDLVLTAGDVYVTLDIIKDWDAGGVADILNFAALNVAGGVGNYGESDGATSLIDALATANTFLGGGVRFWASEVTLAADVTVNGGTVLAAGTTHTLVVADANGDGDADQAVLLQNVGNVAVVGVDGFELTDIQVV